MSIIYKSQLTEWPTGEAHQVVSHFLEKYQPLHMVALIEILQTHWHQYSH